MNSQHGQAVARSQSHAEIHAEAHSTPVSPPLIGYPTMQSSPLNFSVPLLGYPEKRLSLSSSFLPPLGCPDLPLPLTNPESPSSRSTPGEEPQPQIAGTPEELDSGSEEGSGEREEEEEDLHSLCPSQSSDTMPSMDGTVMQVRGILAQNFLFIDDPDAGEIGAAVIAKARSILQNRRGSGLTTPQAQEVVDRIRDVREEPETTF